MGNRTVLQVGKLPPGHTARKYQSKDSNPRVKRGGEVSYRKLHKAEGKRTSRGKAWLPLGTHLGSNMVPIPGDNTNNATAAA